MDIYNWQPGAIKYKGMCFHGTTMDLDSGVFTNLQEDDALWVTSDEYMAEEFAFLFKGSNALHAVFEIYIDLQNAAELIKSPKLDSFLHIHACLDVRDCIPIFKTMGFDGWYTLGSLGTLVYDDIAIFGGSYQVKAVKYYDEAIDDWTEYMSISKFLEIWKDESGTVGSTQNDKTAGFNEEIGLYNSLMSGDIRWACVTDNQRFGVGVYSWHHYKDEADWNAQMTNGIVVPASTKGGQPITPPIVNKLLEERLSGGFEEYYYEDD